MKTATVGQIADALEISERAARLRATKGKWAYEEISGRGGGGKVRKYQIEFLPPDIQKALASTTELSIALIPVLSPEAAVTVSSRTDETKAVWGDESVISMDIIRDPRVKRIARIIQEALSVPRGWKKTKWINHVALKHNTTKATIYKWKKKYEKQGLAGIKHTKKNCGYPKAWTHDAINYWIGLCLKREHRKIAKDALYDILVMEAQKRGWKIGGYESALWWLNKRITPQLEILQRGGGRALDNSLPPVLRSYADLDPFELLVGDQHRFDFWVTDDDTGEVFRPEGYFWQDLRTRCFYGGAIDKRYDAHLCGLALRVGCRVFGAFGSIYTDNGKPELSRYITGILSDMRTLGLCWNRTVDANIDTSSMDSETTNPCVIEPGTHKKAIVKNAKAKMVEGTFNVLEGILRDHFHVPGYCKRLTDTGEEQDIDQDEIKRLAARGKLLTFNEFVVTVFKAMDYYNKEKTHRGVMAEWAWKPKPKAVTPVDCLRACCADGWKPRWLTPEAVDLIFLSQVTGGRVVDRGRIWFKNTPYEHNALVTLNKKRMDVRYDPMDPEWILVFNGDHFVCKAVPVEYSSMKDQDLATRKIEEKRRLRKHFVDQYRALTSGVPDIREYSAIPLAEKAAALIRKKDREELRSDAELYKERTVEQLASEMAVIENYEQQGRPIFSTEVERYEWCVGQLGQGSPLIEEDMTFYKEFETRMDANTREYWEMYKESLNLSVTECEQ